MVCPQCGNKLEEGSLYCAVCGEDIHMVPDFEPELENSIQEILINVAGDMTNDEDRTQQKAASGSEMDYALRNKEKRSIRMLMGIGGAFLGVILLLACIGGVYTYRHNSFDYQMEQAGKALAEERYETACTFLERALQIHESEQSARYYLAQAYYQCGRVSEALDLFQKVAEVETADINMRTDACRRVVNIYTELNDYQMLSDFLLGLEDSQVTADFQKYMAMAPDFSYVEGTYEEVIPLKLTANTSGTIYYTMDGSLPDENSEIYTAPIFMETGDYTVSACFVNDYGVESKTVTKAYHIDVSAPYAPEVSAYSGTYEVPTLIYVEIPEGCRVYYTSDGSEPSSDSSEYVGAISMPVGKSRFKFISYNSEGVSGEITSRNYDLKLKTDISVADAEQRITEGMFEAGKIYDLSGLSYEIFGRYIYRFQYAANDPVIGDYYMIAEVHEDTEGIQVRTGALFAVGIYDGTRYRISLDEAKKYVFTEF